MTDTFSTKKRSEIMRRVKSSGNLSTEVALIKEFKLGKLKGWRRNFKVIGKPDFAFPNSKVIVFADGCFWHGHSCRNTKPSANKRYWKKKVLLNNQRDLKVDRELKKMGWTVIRIWECEIQKKKLERKLNLLKSLLFQ